MGKLTWFTAGVIAGLSAAAIGQELARHPNERTWKGKVAGVPYNFHVAEWSEVAKGYWNPANEKVLSTRGIGLGWGSQLRRRHAEGAGASRKRTAYGATGR